MDLVEISIKIQNSKNIYLNPNLCPSGPGDLGPNSNAKLWYTLVGEITPDFKFKIQ